MDRPQTPPAVLKDATSHSATHSTPNSKGTISNLTHNSRSTQEDYAPFQADDIADERTISVAEFLEWILCVPSDTAVAVPDEFDQYLAKYTAVSTSVSKEHETALYHPFVELANYCMEEMGSNSIYFCRNDPIIVQGSAGKRKPDVVNVYQHAGILEPPSRKRSPDRDSLTVPSDSKRSSQPMPDSAKLQRASYALELLSNGGLRSHVVAALVSGSSLELLYYDRSVVVKSERFWFPENHRNFLAILSAFASLEHRQWGYPQILKTPEGHSSDMFVGSRLKFNIKNELEETWELQLEEKVFSAQGIIGRGTVVMRAKVIQSPAHIVVKDGEDVIVKWIWAPKTRTAEYDILDRTKQHAVNNEEILKHLPEILHGQVVEIGPETLPGQVIQPTCQQHLAKHLPGYEERELRITIQRELKPITDLNPDDLAEAIKGIFKALRWLHETPQILHRDVSRSNLMYHEKGGNIYGVLNDFDLAVPVTRLPRSTSKQRTGTKPYMAIDLLASLPPIHLYRHDLESLMYVMAFLICRIPGSAMENWNSMDVVNLYSRKLQVITTGFPPPINDTFKPLFVKLNKLRLMFGEGLLKRSNYEAELMGADIPGPASNFDANTLGGCVSFAKFAAILE